jgi:hypothetical protein
LRLIPHFTQHHDLLPDINDIIQLAARTSQPTAFIVSSKFRFSLIADPGLPTVRFVPEADVCGLDAEAKYVL